MTYIVFISLGKIESAISGVNLSSRPVQIKLNDFFINGKALSPCSLLISANKLVLFSRSLDEVLTHREPMRVTVVLLARKAVNRLAHTLVERCVRQQIQRTINLLNIAIAFAVLDCNANAKYVLGKRNARVEALEFFFQHLSLRKLRLLKRIRLFLR